jgi:hypothetical protein
MLPSSSPETPTAPAWISSLWAQLSVRYGTAFIHQYEGLDLTLVKLDWASLLRPFLRRSDDGLDAPAIRHALERLPVDRPPNAAQFRALCNTWTPPTQRALAGPRKDRSVEVAHARDLILNKPGGDEPHSVVVARGIVARLGVPGMKLSPQQRSDLEHFSAILRRHEEVLAREAAAKAEADAKALDEPSVNVGG